MPLGAFVGNTAGVNNALPPGICIRLAAVAGFAVAATWVRVARLCDAAGNEGRRIGYMRGYTAALRDGVKPGGPDPDPTSGPDGAPALVPELP